MPQMPALCWDRACPAAPQSKHSSSGITAARLIRLLHPFPPPRNANKLLTPCNVLAFPLNPGFRQGSARRRSHQYIHNAGQSQCYCEPEVEQLHSQQELHLSKEPASAALAGGTTANESGSLQQQTSCPGSGQAGAAPALSLPFPLRREGTQAHTPPPPAQVFTPHTFIQLSTSTETGNTMWEKTSCSHGLCPHRP